MSALLIFFLILADAMSASAQASSVKPSLEVEVLGSGGPRAFGRAGSSYIVLVDGTPRILLDAGPGAFVRIGELNINLQHVDIVLLTHLHIDHSGDLAAFFNARGLTSDGPIKYRVFGPDGAGLFPETSRFVDLVVGDKGLFGYQRTFGAQETFSVRDLAIELNTGVIKIVDENGLMVEEIATHHGDCPSVAYRIRYHGSSVVFSGDMDASAISNLVRLAKNADLLVFNCAVLDPPGSPTQLYELHTPPKKIGEAARESGVGNLLLSHIAPDVEESKNDVLKSIHSSFTGPVEFATDRMHVSVEHKLVSAH
jgi:ribonuclease BN (tRNA processing enzyme)